MLSARRQAIRRAMAEARFKAGDVVRAKRERRLVMKVLASETPDVPLPAMVQCQPLGDARAHGRGAVPRWFREDDLVSA